MPNEPTVAGSALDGKYYHVSRFAVGSKHRAGRVQIPEASRAVDRRTSRARNIAKFAIGVNVQTGAPPLPPIPGVEEGLGSHKSQIRLWWGQDLLAVQFAEAARHKVVGTVASALFFETRVDYYPAINGAAWCLP